MPDWKISLVLVLAAIALGATTGWVAYQAFDGQDFRVAATLVAALVVPGTTVGTNAAGIVLRLRADQRATEDAHTTVLNQRVSAARRQDEIDPRSTGEPREAAALRDLTAYLDALAALKELLTLARPGELSPTQADSAQFTTEEGDELRRLLAESRAASASLDARGWFLRGNAAYGAKQWDSALAAYDMSISMEPDMGAAHVNRGITLNELDRPNEALAALCRATELGLGSHWAVLIGRGAAFYHMEQWEEALREWDRALKLLPDSPGLNDNVGVALGQLKRYEDALPHFWRAVGPEQADALKVANLGTALTSAGHFDEAIPVLERAIELRPDEPNSRYNLACAHSQLGHGDQALTELKQAMADGFSECEDMAEGEDLASLRAEFPERFAKLLEQCRSNQKPGE